MWEFAACLLQMMWNGVYCVMNLYSTHVAHVIHVWAILCCHESFNFMTVASVYSFNFLSDISCIFGIYGGSCNSDGIGNASEALFWLILWMVQMDFMYSHIHREFYWANENNTWTIDHLKDFISKNQYRPHTYAYLIVYWRFRSFCFSKFVTAKYPI